MTQLTTQELRRIVEETPDDQLYPGRWVVKLCRNVEAEVRLRDEELIKQLLDYATAPPTSRLAKAIKSYILGREPEVVRKAKARLDPKP